MRLKVPICMRSSQPRMLLEHSHNVHATHKNWESAHHLHARAVDEGARQHLCGRVVYEGSEVVERGSLTLVVAEAGLHREDVRERHVGWQIGEVWVLPVRLRPIWCVPAHGVEMVVSELGE